jgi:hypothetical protein
VVEMNKSEKEELIKEFKEQFEAMKTELGFKSTLAEIEKVFFITDSIIREGYISKYLSRQICRRITDLFGSWYNYLHSLVMPSPGSMLNMTESQAFSDEEKHEIMILMNKIMALASKNTLVGITKDKKMEAGFIDESVAFWSKTVKPEMKRIVGKVQENWAEKSKLSTPIDFGGANK